MFEAVIWLVPVAVLLTGVRYPRGGILVLVAALPLFGSPPGGPYLGALDVAALLAVLTAWRGSRARPSPLDVAAVAFVVVGLASLVPLAWHPPSWTPHDLLGLLLEFPYVERWSILYTWRAAANLCLGWLLFLGVRRSFNRDNVIELGLALALGEALVLVLGLARLAGLINLGGYRVIGDRMYDARLHSLFFHSGWLAEFLVIATPVAMACLWRVRRWGAWAAAGLAALAVPSIIFTEQRGAWFCLLLELGVAGILLARRLLERPGSRRRLLVTGLVVAAAVTILVTAVSVRNPSASRAVVARSQRLASDLSNRTRIWRLSWNVGRERWVLGWGVGSFSPVFDLVATSGTRHHSAWLTAHNQYLMLFVERGLLAVAGFLLLAISTVLGLLKLVRARAPDRDIALALIVSAAAVGLYGAVQYLFFLRMMEWLIWILLGMAAVLLSGHRSRWVDRIAWGLAVVALLTGVVRIGGETAPGRGDRAYGLHPQQRQHAQLYRWTSARAAMRVTRHVGDLDLEVANGHPQAGRYPVQLTVSIDGTPVRTLRLADSEWRSVRLLSTELPDRDFVLGLRARPSFRPFIDAARDPSLRPSRDIRLLGVAMQPLKWVRRGPQSPVSGPQD